MSVLERAARFMTLENSSSEFALLAISPFVGSFLAAFAWRWPRGQSTIAPRSHCDSCKHELTALDLVPVLSWLWLKGRCRHCAAGISSFYPLIELAALAVAIWSATVTDGWIAWLTACLGWSLMTLAVIDFQWLLLPNLVTLPLLALGLAMAASLSWQQVGDAALGASAAFAAFALIGTVYRRIRGRDGLGLGDAKLVAAGGAWVGWQGLPSVALLAAVGGIAGVWISGRLISTASARDPIPFGPYLAAAIWLVWLYGPLIPGAA
jgi:leader peptidase (prepilin peptidase)/N-methyltransferase